MACIHGAQYYTQPCTLHLRIRTAEGSIQGYLGLLLGCGVWLGVVFGSAMYELLSLGPLRDS